MFSYLRNKFLESGGLCGPRGRRGDYALGRLVALVERRNSKPVPVTLCMYTSLRRGMGSRDVSDHPLACTLCAYVCRREHRKRGLGPWGSRLKSGAGLSDVGSGRTHGVRKMMWK